MNWFGNTQGGGGFWLAPASAGVLMILLGIAIILEPDILAFAVAGVFIVAGLSVLSFAWSLRAKVTYRRMDDPFEAGDDDRL